MKDYIGMEITANWPWNDDQWWEKEVAHRCKQRFGPRWRIMDKLEKNSARRDVEEMLVSHLEALLEARDG